MDDSRAGLSFEAALDTFLKFPRGSSRVFL